MIKPIDFEVVIGDGFSFPWRRKVGPKDALVQVDLSTHIGVMNVFGDDPLVPMISLTTENGGLVLGNATSDSMVIMTPAQTSLATKAKPRAYEIKVTDQSGNTRTVMYGHLKFVKLGG